MHPFRWLLTLTLVFSLLTGGFAPLLPDSPAAAKAKGGKKGKSRPKRGKSKPKKSKPRKGQSRPRSKAKSKPRRVASKPKTKAKNKPKSTPRRSVRRPVRPVRPLRRPARRPVRPVRRPGRVVVAPRSPGRVVVARPGTRVVVTNPFPGFVRRYPLRGPWLTVNPGGSLVIDPTFINPGIVGSTAPIVIQPTQPFPTANSCTSDLLNVLLNLDVENHWRAGNAVDWRTGDPISGAPPAPINSGPFVYAVANQQRVPLPDPDPATMVAAPLIRWLMREGTDRGWQQVSPLEAQLLANQCWVVVAGWRNPNPAAGDPYARGLAAVVRPDTRPTAEIATRGPRITLAGVTNANDTTVKSAFPQQAWDDNQIVYLAHKPASSR
jgi:hypothetical protein